jgi:hypothetical protein
LSMCLFACPLLVLYLLGVGVAFLAHPSRRKSKATSRDPGLGILVLALVRLSALLNGQRQANRPLRTSPLW